MCRRLQRERRFLWSIWYKGSHKETASLESVRFKRMDSPILARGSTSFRASNSETLLMKLNSSMEMNFDSSSLPSSSFKEEVAALKIQKVYRDYCTRRNLADRSEYANELWWQAIEFVMLKRSNISVFDSETSETAASRWSRARVKASKVGKGLSKDGKVRKLAFQYWLEAIDPRHRCGQNLHFYYDAWFESDTVQPFFYWLDVGDGRDLNLDCCSRAKLHQQCIKYLGPKEREQYEVIVVDGKLHYMHSGELVDTSKGSKGSKWIFVLSPSKKLYIGQKKKGTFQHSSFLAGGAISAAGRLVVDEGVLKSIWPYSGYYLPTEENFDNLISFLVENNIDLTNVQMTSYDEDELSVHRGNNLMTMSEPNSKAERDEHGRDPNLYKSHRTRWNLADRAEDAEELWWQAIEFVMLKRSNISFFDSETSETAGSRWSRARVKASKVGKGLSKDDKARKLAFQHWLEAIDSLHRYGHNLHLYFEVWFKSNTRRPFFHWLDYGDGRDLNLDHCSRAKLQQQCIKYLGPKERKKHEVIVFYGKLFYRRSGGLVDTSKGSKGSKWIFVLSTFKILYIGQKKKGTFQHSSFLAGGAISAAGRLVVDEGVLKSIWPSSGHYRPTEENLDEFISFLEENNIDLTNVQVFNSPDDEDELSVHLENNLMSGSEPNTEAERDERHLVEKLEKVDSQKEFRGTNTILKETEANAVFWPNERNDT